MHLPSDETHFSMQTTPRLSRETPLQKGSFNVLAVIDKESHIFFERNQKQHTFQNEPTLWVALDTSNSPSTLYELYIHTLRHLDLLVNHHLPTGIIKERDREECRNILYKG